MSLWHIMKPFINSVAYLVIASLPSVDFGTERQIITSRKMLSDLVHNHSSFNNTIFQNSPILLRKYSELTVQRIRNVNISFHIFYTLTFPVLTNSDFFPIYTVHQTGFIANESCYELNLPDYLILQGVSWYEVRCHSNLPGICPIKEGALTKWSQFVLHLL